MPARFEKIAFVASDTDQAQAGRERLVARYGDVSLDQAGVVVALGGDGFMLQTLHDLMGTSMPIYGMNRGSVGFLMNEFRETGLRKRLLAAERSTVHPLAMTATSISGETLTANAINEISLLRRSYQAAKLKISVDGQVRLEELVADGLLLATPAGSTAYNLSVNGPILPLNTPLLALTPISPFRPRRWRGALLPNRAHVRIDVLEPEKRPVNAVADHTQVEHVVSVVIAMNMAIDLVMLHDPGHSLDERILREQFGY